MFQFYQNTEPNKLQHKKIACLGVGTANALESFKITPNFIGQKEITEVAVAFSKLIGDQKVLFPKAKESKRSVQKILNSKQVLELVIYSTSLNDLYLSDKFDVVVFTSPSNVRAFFQSGNLITENQKAISIGKSTEKELLNFKTVNTLTKSYLEKDWAAAVLF